MASEHTDLSATDDRRARHKALAEVLQGTQSMEWSHWTLPVYDSQCLTPQGLQVALWAVETLQRALGENFFQGTALSGSHPIYSLGLWPGMNDVPWVYANLFQLAAQIRLLDLPHVHFEDIQKIMSRSKQPHEWIHSLLQLEIAGLGLKAGWQILFEPELGTGKRADISLSRLSTRLLVETLSMSLSKKERNALSSFRNLSWQLLQLEWQYGVQISGSIGDPLSQEHKTQWLQDIETAVCATSQDGAPRVVLSPAKGRVEIGRETTTTGSVHLESAPVETNVGMRLIERLADKNEQFAGAEPAWVRLDEYAGLWQSTSLQGVTLSEKLNVLTPFLQQALASFSNVAGVILAPAVLWAGNAPPETLSERIESSGSIAVRSPLPGHRVRESIIVAQAAQPYKHAGVFADWYEQEATWLDWALEQLGHPPFPALVQDNP